MVKITIKNHKFNIFKKINLAHLVFLNAKIILFNVINSKLHLSLIFTINIVST